MKTIKSSLRDVKKIVSSLPDRGKIYISEPSAYQMEESRYRAYVLGLIVTDINGYKYCYVRALENIALGDVVYIDADGNASQPAVYKDEKNEEFINWNGIARVSKISKGNYGTVELINMPGGGEGSGSALWGKISGNISDQTDLTLCLDEKSDIYVIPGENKKLSDLAIGDNIRGKTVTFDTSVSLSADEGNHYIELSGGSSLNLSGPYVAHTITFSYNTISDIITIATGNDSTGDTTWNMSSLTMPDDEDLIVTNKVMALNPAPFDTSYVEVNPKKVDCEELYNEIQEKKEEWGSISGNISDQTDLKTALDEASTKATFANISGTIESNQTLNTAINTAATKAQWANITGTISSNTSLSNAIEWASEHAFWSGLEGNISDNTDLTAALAKKSDIYEVPSGNKRLSDLVIGDNLRGKTVTFDTSVSLSGLDGNEYFIDINEDRRIAFIKINQSTMSFYYEDVIDGHEIYFATANISSGDMTWDMSSYTFTDEIDILVNGKNISQNNPTPFDISYLTVDGRSIDCEALQKEIEDLSPVIADAATRADFANISGTIESNTTLQGAFDKKSDIYTVQTGTKLLKDLIVGEDITGKTITFDTDNISFRAFLLGDYFGINDNITLLARKDLVITQLVIEQYPYPGEEPFYTILASYNSNTGRTNWISPIFPIPSDQPYVITKKANPLYLLNLKDSSVTVNTKNYDCEALYKQAQYLSNEIDGASITADFANITGTIESNETLQGAFDEASTKADWSGLEGDISDNTDLTAALAKKSDVYIEGDLPTVLGNLTIDTDLSGGHITFDTSLSLESTNLNTYIRMNNNADMIRYELDPTKSNTGEFYIKYSDQEKITFATYDIDTKQTTWQMSEFYIRNGTYLVSSKGVGPGVWATTSIVLNEKTYDCEAIQKEIENLTEVVEVAETTADFANITGTIESNETLNTAINNAAGTATYSGLSGTIESNETLNTAINNAAGTATFSGLSGTIESNTTLQGAFDKKSDIYEIPSTIVKLDDLSVGINLRGQTITFPTYITSVPSGTSAAASITMQSSSPNANNYIQCRHNASMTKDEFRINYGNDPSIVFCDWPLGGGAVTWYMDKYTIRDDKSYIVFNVASTVVNHPLFNASVIGEPGRSVDCQELYSEDEIIWKDLNTKSDIATGVSIVTPSVTQLDCAALQDEIVYLKGIIPSGSVAFSAITGSPDQNANLKSALDAAATTADLDKLSGTTIPPDGTLGQALATASTKADLDKLSGTTIPPDGTLGQALAAKSDIATGTSISTPGVTQLDCAALQDEIVYLNQKIPTGSVPFSDITGQPDQNANLKSALDAAAGTATYSGLSGTIASNQALNTAINTASTKADFANISGTIASNQALNTAINTASTKADFANITGDLSSNQALNTAINTASTKADFANITGDLSSNQALNTAINTASTRADFANISGTIASNETLNTAINTAATTATWGQIKGKLDDQPGLTALIETVVAAQKTAEFGSISGSISDNEALNALFINLYKKISDLENEITELRGKIK